MINPINDMLVVVDYQVDFVTGSLGFPKALELDDKLPKIIADYHDRNQVIVVTLDTHDDNYLNTIEGKHLPIPHCKIGSDGWKLYGNTGKLISYIDEKKYKYLHVFEKYKFGIDPYDILELQRKYRNIKNIQLVGLVTNICVFANAIIFQSAFPDAEISINKNYNASNDSESELVSFDAMRSLQINIIE